MASLPVEEAAACEILPARRPPARSSHVISRSSPRAMFIRGSPLLRAASGRRSASRATQWTSQAASPRHPQGQGNLRDHADENNQDDKGTAPHHSLSWHPHRHADSSERGAMMTSISSNSEKPDGRRVPWTARKIAVSGPRCPGDGDKSGHMLI